MSRHLHLFSSLAVVVTLALATPGCNDTDLDAPAPPRLHVGATETALERIVLSGTAEPGAKVTVTREPAAPEALAPGLVADLYTAAFEAEVPLELGENVFTVHAVDAAGNRSAPSSITVTRVPPAPRGLTLTSAVSLIDADLAEVELLAQLAHHEPISLEGMEVQLRAVHEAEGIEERTATAKADAQGRARATLAGLSTTGRWTITAIASDDPSLSDSVTVLVTGGAPASLELSLEALGPDGQPTSGGAITVGPDATIHAKVIVRDAPENVLDVPIALFTDAPGALIAGNTLRGVTRAAAQPWRVLAVVNGAVTGEATFQVVPGDLASLELGAARALAYAGEPVALQVTAVDAWGNPLTDLPVSFDVEPPLDAAFTPPGATQTLTDQGVTDHIFKAYDLSEVEDAGYRFSITATAPGASASTTIEVRPGRAEGFRLVADPAGGGGLVPDLFFTSGCAQGASRCSTASVAAGQELTFAWSLADRWGNRTDGALQSFTDAPGAVVFDDPLTGTGTITQLTRAHATSWTLSTRVAGVNQPPLTRAFFVGAAAPAEMVVSTNPTVVAAGGTVQAFAAVRDVYGNPLACPANPDAALTLTSTPAAADATPLGCNDGTFSRTFTFAGSGGYTVEGKWLAGSVVGSAHVTVAGDSTAPTVGIANLLVDGVPCGAGVPTRCTVAPGALVEFDVEAADDSALAEVAYSVYFESAQTERARTVLLSGGQCNHTARFSFTVPSNTRPEQTALVARAGDLGGNVAHTPELLLDVSIGAVALGGRPLSVVTTDSQGLADPTDLVQLPNGDLIVANRTNSTLVRLPAGSRTLRPFGSHGWINDRLALDSSGRIYVGTPQQRTLRFSPDGSVQEMFVQGGFTTTGAMALTPPLPQRAFIRNLDTASDGNSVTVDSGPNAMTYEIDLNGSCTTSSGRICVPVASGESIAAALADAINGNLASRVSAIVESTSPAKRVGLVAKTAGEDSAISLSATGSLAVDPFAGGHDEELWLGRSALISDPLAPMPRFPLSGSLPWNSVTHGAFEYDGSVTLAVRDIWSVDRSSTTTDLVVYSSLFTNSRMLKAYRIRANPQGSSVDPYQDGNTIFRLSTGFQRIADLALSADGRCLLAADDGGPGKGRVWAIDVSDPTRSGVTAEQILDGLEKISGITLDNQGRLLVIDASARVIYRLGPASPLPAGSCF